MGWACRSNSGDTKCIQDIIVETSWKAPTLGQRGRWEDNIKVDFREII